MTEKSEKRSRTYSADIIYFMGSVDATLKTIDKRLTSIESKQGQVCPAHDSILQLINNQKETNLNQRARNEARTVEQTAQDVKIRDLQEADRVIEVKLSPRQEQKINYTLAAGVGSIVIWIATYILRIMGYQI